MTRQEIPEPAAAAHQAIAAHVDEQIKKVRPADSDAQGSRESSGT